MEQIFSNTTLTVNQLIEKIDTGELGLPELQRPFIWKDSKVRDLFDSLMRGYPIGYLMLWECPTLEKKKSIGVDSHSYDAPKEVIIDGQQRLTSLYAVMKGKKVINSKFDEKAIIISYNPLQDKFEVGYQATKKDPEWIYNISEVYTTSSSFKFINGFIKRLAEYRENKGDVLTEAEQDTISENINAIVNLKNHTLPVFDKIIAEGLCSGGIVGQCFNKGVFTIRNCANYGEIRGKDETDGITGNMGYNTSVSSCLNNGNITGNQNVGGILGFTELGTIGACANFGTVRANEARAGGIAGTDRGGWISDCFNAGSVSAGSMCGGIAGNLYVSTMINTLSVGKVSADENVGTVVGAYDWSCTLTHNYYWKYTGHPYAAGNGEPDDYDDDEILGLFESEYRHNGSGLAYIDWDFDDIWKMTDYGPRLRGAGVYQSGDVITVLSARDLQALSEMTSLGESFEGVTIRLDADIDMSGVEDFKPIGGERYYDGAKFAGVFDGQGHAVSGLCIETDERCSGFFGNVSGTVKNLIVAGSVTGGNSVGGIAGYVYGGTVDNCSFLGSVTGSKGVGGIAGCVLNGEIRGCSVSGSVIGSGEGVGGIAGIFQNDIIELCSAYAEVTGVGQNVGGVAGEQVGGSIRNCIHSGSVTGVVTGSGDDATLTSGVGGVVGHYSSGDLVLCCHDGAVSGFFNVGGVIGYKEYAISTPISNIIGSCYYLAGGLTYYTLDGLTHDDVGIGGFAAVNEAGAYSSGYADVLTQAEYADADSFAYWNFDTVWKMTDGRPALRAEIGIEMIRFEANGGSGEMNDYIIPLTGGRIPACAFTREGYFFVGWNTAADGSGTTYEDGADVPADASLTLYALWAAAEDVSYIDGNGFEFPASNCIVLDTSYTSLRNSWYVAGGTLDFTSRIEISGEVTIILKDGAVLNAPMGIHALDTADLTAFSLKRRSSTRWRITRSSLKPTKMSLPGRLRVMTA